MMDRENKKILTAVILIILLAITGYIYYHNRFPIVTGPQTNAPANTSTNVFHGPTSIPYIKGPSGPPPGSMGK